MERTTPGGVVAAVMFGVGLALSALVASGSAAAAQPAPLCTRFEAGAAGQDNWGPCPSAPNIVVTTSNVGSIGGATDYHLHLRDTSGASAACSSDEKYLGDWAAKMGGCGEFCFDFKLFKSGTPPASVHPSFSIYNGTQRAVFIANVVLTSADPWQQHICAPISLTQSGEHLPSNSSGEWRVLDSSGTFSNAANPNWNAIVTGVTSVQLPVDFTSDPSEEVGYDNFCMNPVDCKKPPPPPELTGCLKDAKVEVKCNPDGTYTLVLSTAGASGDDITLTSLTPGVTVAVPLQPWSATTTWTLVGATPGQAVTLASTTTKVGGGSVPGTDLCCSGEIKIVMPDCPKPPPPIDVKIDKKVVDGPAGLGFQLSVTNAGGPISFPAGGLVVVDSIPAGFTVTGYAGTSPNWSCVPPSLVGPGQITCTYNLAGTLGAGAPLPDVIVVNGFTTTEKPIENCATVTTDPVVGADKNLDNNKDCVTLNGHETPPIDLKIDKGVFQGKNGTGFQLVVTNVGAPISFPAGGLTVVDSIPAGFTVTGLAGTSPNWTCTPSSLVGPGQITCTYNLAGTLGTGALLPDLIEIRGQMTQRHIENCAVVSADPAVGVESDLGNNKDCQPADRIPTTPIDIKIEKTGATSPPVNVPWYSFTLKVTNVDGAFAGNGAVTVTDTVPTGMTFTAVVATLPGDWACPAMPAAAGTAVTCTYIGSGPTAPNQVLGTIKFTAQAMGNGPFPPIENCADAGTTPDSGFVDSNLDDNHACVTVTKPAILVCDPKTTKSDSGACVCLYQKMTKTSPTACGCRDGARLVAGKGCIAELVCKAPLIKNNAGTKCICRGTLIWNGKDCVKQVEPQKVPNRVPLPDIKLPNVFEIVPKSEPNAPGGPVK